MPRSKLARLGEATVLESAVHRLAELSLIDIGDDEPLTFQVHPLVREYACHDRRVATEATPTAGDALVLVTDNPTAVSMEAP
ncbi:MAG: hypothetical protein HQL37_09715 [Alphaproteobacteria bacterium]|nr:hypothetical protein [Alphaproteobacteria bacterium]